MGSSETDSPADPTTRDTDAAGAPRAVPARSREAESEDMPAVKPTEEEVLERLGKESVAPSTEKVYARHWRAFASWCEGQDRVSLPATEKTVQAFAAAQAAGGLSLSTIRGRLAAVGYIHRTRDFSDPTASETIGNTMEHLARRFGTPAEKKKALRSGDISDMVRALPGSPEGSAPDGDRSGTADARRLRGIRDRALILVGFAGALRRSELAGMEVSWLSFNPKGFEVEIPRSKGDAEGEGQIVGISRGESVDLCPVRALRRWIEAASIEEGPIFRSVPNHGIVAPDERAAPISGQAVADAVKRAAENVGLDTEKISGHSLRRGHLTTAARNGAELVDLQRQARHADPRTTAEYVEDANRMETNTSRHLGL